MTAKTRTVYTFFIWIITASVYIICGSIHHQSWTIPETFFDKYIPFSSSGIWLYLSFYIFIPYAFFKVDSDTFKRLSIAFIATSIISGLFFIFFPSTIIYPSFQSDSASTRVLSFVSQNDTDQNCFPSLHASLITLCTIGLFRNAGWLRRLILSLLILLMFYSIIQVRRHVFIDLAAGSILASAVWTMVGNLWGFIR